MPDPAAPPATLHLELLLQMDEELRASLSGIIGMMELVLDTRLTVQQQGYLRLGRASADALLSAINNLLSAATIEAKLFELDPIPFSLRDSLGYSIGVLALRTQERNFKLVSNILEHVPDALIGDPVVLRQVIGNLIEHAARPPGGGIVMLRVEKEWDAAQTVQLEFSVSRHDPANTAPRSPEAAPTPLLTITTRLIEAMGGRLWVASGRGRDEVRCSLPFGVQSQPVVAPSPMDPSAVHDLPALVVDHQPMHRHLLEEMLSRWGMRPTAVENGPAALAALQRAAAARTPIPLVLLDAAMPEMDGFDLAARIRQEPAFAASRLVVLALAGRRGDAARCRQLGVAAYLTRPVSQADLFDAILTVLGMPPEAPAPFLVTRHSLRERARPLRVLVLDDQPRDHALLVRTLEEDGHTVLTAATPAEAVAVFEQQPINVVLVEEHWCGLEAERVVALAREPAHGEPPAVIAVARRWSVSAHRHAQRAGIQACLARPLRAASVRKAIEAVRTAPMLLHPVARNVKASSRRRRR